MQTASKIIVLDYLFFFTIIVLCSCITLNVKVKREKVIIVIFKSQYTSGNEIYSLMLDKSKHFAVSVDEAPIVSLLMAGILWVVV